MPTVLPWLLKITGSRFGWKMHPLFPANFHEYANCPEYRKNTT